MTRRRVELQIGERRIAASAYPHPDGGHWVTLPFTSATSDQVAVGKEVQSRGRTFYVLECQDPGNRHEVWNLRLATEPPDPLRDVEALEPTPPRTFRPGDSAGDEESQP